MKTLSARLPNPFRADHDDLRVWLYTCANNDTLRNFLTSRHSFAQSSQLTASSAFTFIESSYET
jgi:hypothetical protein